MVSQSSIPFHLQAEDEGNYVLEDRARDDSATRRTPAVELWEYTDYSD